MTDVAVAALSVLGGALIGSISGTVSTIMAYKQAKSVRESEERRHTWQLGLELGLKEWATQTEDARAQGGTMWPPQVYAYFSARFLQLAAENKLTPASYEELDREVLAIARAVKKAQDLP